MFNWQDFTYDNDWLSISVDGINSFYLCDSGVAIPDEMSEFAIRKPEFIESLLLARQHQQKAFSKEGIAKRECSRFKFMFHYGDTDEYSTFQILASPFLEEHEAGRYQKLYHEWYLEEQVKKAKEAGKAESDAAYLNTIESLRHQVNLLNKIVQQNKVLEKGGAHEIIEKLLEQSRKEHEQQMAEIQRAKAELEKLRQHTDYGYVYLFHDTGNNAYKIGKSKKPDGRLSQIRTSAASTVECICTIETNDMTALEMKLHDQFAAKRIRGEWFHLTIEDVELIKQQTLERTG